MVSLSNHPHIDIDFYTHIIDFMPGEFITKKGLEKLKEELSGLVNKKRPEVARRIKEAVSFGDLSENAEYTEAKEQQAFTEGRISEIENILRNVSLVSKKSAKASFVQISCAVSLVSGSQKRVFKLVGKSEGNPSAGEISSDSPIGKALLGRVVGDEIDVPTPSGKKQYRIVKIA